jgi:NADP-dependent 3-hydroxy acid dehydrogenase YdfG
MKREHAALRNRRVRRTGASSEIGTATVLVRAGAGADVMVSVRRAGKLNQLSQKTKAAGGEAVLNPLNAADRCAMRRAGAAQAKIVAAEAIADGISHRTAARSCD